MRDRIRDRRLITLIGPGGIGKTALARAVVDACATDFGEGARVVDLTRVDTAEAVRESIAAQLGYSSFTAMLEAPGDRSVLILADNCEHVVDAAADAVEQLLAECQMPTVLATSRIALEVPGEVVVPVAPLTLPPKGTVDAAAVDLFVARARDASADVEPSEEVAELCRRLDGVPLAIELAAARARAMTPAEMLARLDAGLDVLHRPRRRGASRHQSLRAAIGWSYELLDSEEQAMFARLSVFSGPFTAALAHAVAARDGTTEAHTQDLLDRLVAASVVVAEVSGPATWYRELETLRAFAREQLERRGERDEAEDRFVDHVVARALGIIEGGAASWSHAALAELLSMYDNIAAAIRWCVANDDLPGRALVLSAVLWGVVHQAHTEEIGGLVEQVLDRWPDTDDPLRPDAVATAATCRYMLGDHERAVAMAEAALASAGTSPYAPVTLRRAIAQSRRATGDTAGAAAMFAAAADEARRAKLVALAVEADAARAHILADIGDITTAVQLAAKAQADARAAGSDVAAAWALAVEGSIRLRVDVGEATAVLEAALEASRALPYDAGIAVSLRCLALAALASGDHREASVRTLELLAKVLERGSTSELRMVLDPASAILDRVGRRAAAANLAATALSLPVVSITASVGHELFPCDPTGGTVLSVRDAILTTRAELTAVTGGQPDPPPVAPAASDERVGVFRRAGDYWEIGFSGELATVQATKGMDDLTSLLRQPGREVHCLDLVGAAVEQGSTGEALDAPARRAYEERVRELQAELDGAEADHDRSRAEKLQDELDAVVDQLTAALGLHGRGREQGASAERARSTVTQRIRSTIRRIEAVHPRLGRHLQAAIRTGTFCAYEPEEPVRWQT